MAHPTERDRSVTYRLWIIWGFLGSSLCLSACTATKNSSSPNQRDRAAAPTNLRCEYQYNPVGIDTMTPRFSWQVNDARPGAVQSAYQVVVGRDESFEDGSAAVWDSGVVQSDQSAHVEYAGPTLESRARYYWRVRTWDADGEASSFSEPCFWEMGLLDAADWKAKWIGPADDFVREPAMTFGAWMWDPQAKGDKANSAFRKSFEVDRDAVDQIILKVAADNAYELDFNGQRVGWGNSFNVAQRYDLKPRLRSGGNVIGIKAWNEGGPMGLTVAGVVVLNDGSRIELSSGEGWKTMSDPPAGWQATDFDDNAWHDSVVVGNYGDDPWGKIGEQVPPRESVYVRKGFSLNRPVSRARAYVTGLGLYELHVNGRRVGDDIFTPGWTNYFKRIQYQTYDVTDLINNGDNAIGAILGNGWWSGGLGWEGSQQYSQGKLRFRLQLRLDYEDGTFETIVSDTDWKSHASPILKNNYYDGEEYDARLEVDGWDTPGFSDALWKPMVEVDAPTDKLVAQQCPTIQVTQELAPAWISEPDKGVYILDFGQNASGRLRMRVTAPAGTKIQLRFGELLDNNGRLYRDNYRTAKATDIYICRGGGEETWEPRFTYRGFRYCEVTGWPQENADQPHPPSSDAFTMRVLHSAAPQTGTFECSDRLLNAIHRAVMWGQRSNLHSVPTDCPQRDERLGWMGDAQTFSPTACWNMNMHRFFRKYLYDVEDSRTDEGAVTDVAPAIVVGGAAKPGWGDAVCIIPWTVYNFYGDRRVLEENYDQMRGWVEYMRGKSKGDLYEQSGYGDWVPAYGIKSPSEPIGSAYYYWSTTLVADAARVLGKDDDAKQYRELAGRIRDAFNAKHLNLETNQYTGGTQTANILPLWFGMTPDDRRDAVMANIRSDIEARGDHVTTGFLGTAYIMPLLSRHGLDEVAYRLAAQTSQPSLGYMVLNGATTIWERWDSDKQGPSMNSRNHFAFGCGVQWFYETIAGINYDPEQPGFKRIIIRPRILGDLTWARGEYMSLYGMIRSEWRLNDDALELTVRIPANTSAEVHVPVLGTNYQKTDPALIPLSVNGEHFSSTSGVGLNHVVRDAIVFDVGAGEYQFVLQR